MSKIIGRLERIVASIEDIDYILESSELKVTRMIEDRMIKPAVRMHLVRVAEQFAKLKDENAFKTLEAFNPADLRGIAAVRNYIAHDYDSVDDGIIEDVIRFNLPAIKKTAIVLLSEMA